jgi:hypothetical protein
MATTEEHNRKMFSEWEKEFNAKGVKAWFILGLTADWKNTAKFVEVFEVDLPQNLRRIAHIIENNKKKGGNA